MGLAESAAPPPPVGNPVSLRSWLALSVPDRILAATATTERALNSAGESGAWIALEHPAHPAHPAHPGQLAGPLAGIPFSVKDNIDVAGFATTAGSPLFPPEPVADDAGVVGILKDAGALVIGKTNLHELAFGITSNNATFGAVRNPRDPARSAGGSSGGSAVTVAAGLVPFGLGTDTGGSVLIPAAFCGVVGFRPTVGRYPGDGVVNLSSSRDTIGLHTATVTEARFIDQLITRTVVRAEPPFQLSGARLGLPRTRYQDIDAGIAAVVQRTLDSLVDAGVEVVHIDIEDDIAVGAGPGIEIVMYEAARLLKLRLTPSLAPEENRSPREWLPRIASPDVHGLVELMASSPVSIQAYRAAQVSRRQLHSAYASAYQRYSLDAIVSPTTPVPPPLIGEDITISLNGRSVSTFGTVTRNTAPGTVAGLPMISVPTSAAPDGLPVGICLEGSAFADRHLLRLAEAVQQRITDDGLRPPA